MQFRFLSIALSASFTCLSSQVSELPTTGPQSRRLYQVVWGENGSWLYVPPGYGSFQYAEVKDKKPRILPLPKTIPSDRYMFHSAARGHAFTMGLENSDSVGVMYNFSLSEGKDWVRLGEMDERLCPVPPQSLQPLDDDLKLFLAYSSEKPMKTKDFTQKEVCGFVARFRLNKGQFEVDSMIELPYKTFKNIATFKDGKAVPVHWALNPGFDSQPLVTQKYFVIASRKAGVLWFLDATSGECRRTIELTDLEPQDLDCTFLYKGGYILGMQPMPDGRVLVATRHPDVVKLAKFHYVSPVKGGLEGFKKGMRDYKASTQDIGSIRWWTIDPETWEVTPMEDPSYPQEMYSHTNLSSLDFILDRQGKLITNANPDRHFGHWYELLKDQGLVKEEPEPPKNDSKSKSPTPSKQSQQPPKKVTASQEKPNQ